jgi:hypothetical protein
LKCGKLASKFAFKCNWYRYTAGTTQLFCSLCRAGVRAQHWRSTCNVPEAGLSLPRGVVLVTWTTLAVINMLAVIN